MDKEKITPPSIKIFWSLGHAFALILSWIINKSIWWGLLHLVIGWWYVVFWGLKYSKLEQFVTGLMK